MDNVACFYKCARPYCMAYFSSVADLPSVSLLFLFEVIPYTGARTLDGFVEFLEQSLKTPSTVSFLTFLPPNLSDFSMGFLVASLIELRNWLDPLINSFKFCLLGGRRGREGCSGQGWIIRCVGFESLLGKRVRVCCVAMFSLMYVINEHLKKTIKKYFLFFPFFNYWKGHFI